MILIRNQDKIRQTAKEYAYKVIDAMMNNDDFNAVSMHGVPYGVAGFLKNVILDTIHVVIEYIFDIDEDIQQDQKASAINNNTYQVVNNNTFEVEIINDPSQANQRTETLYNDMIFDI